VSPEAIAAAREEVRNVMEQPLVALDTNNTNTVSPFVHRT